MAGSLDGFMTGLRDEVMRAATTGSGPQNLPEAVQAFVAAINWEEPLILSIIATHGILWTAFVFTRNNVNAQAVLFGIAATIVMAAEAANSYAAERWQLIATQNYFDEQGFFVTAMVVAPILALTLAMVISLVCSAAGLLVKQKRLQLQHERRAKAAKEAKSAKDKASAPATSNASHNKEASVTKAGAGLRRRQT